MRQSTKGSIFLCKSIFALILHTEPIPPLERENDLPREPKRSRNWSYVMFIFLSFFCTLFHGSHMRFLYQKFPLSDSHVLDLSSRLKHCQTGSLADLEMQLTRRSCAFWLVPSVPSKKICILILRLYILIRYHGVRPITLTVTQRWTIKRTSEVEDPIRKLQVWPWLRRGYQREPRVF